MVSKHVVVRKGSLDQEGTVYVVRGVVDPDTFGHVQIGDYQREQEPESVIDRMARALQASERFADAELAMRGDDWSERGGVITLRDPVFVVDGQQRLAACLRAMAVHGVKDPHFGVAVYLNVTAEWEAARFAILNARRTKVSACVLLRNLGETNGAVGTLRSLSRTDSDFALRSRVQWTQRARVRDLITAVMLLKAAGRLHAHFGPTLNESVERLAGNVQAIMERVGRTALRANVRSFFELVDQCWGIERLTSRKGAAHLRTPFLFALASVLSRHTNFWNDNELRVPRALLERLQKFDCTTEMVVAATGSGSQGRKVLDGLLCEHLDKVRGASNKLVARPDAVPVEDDNAPDDTEDK